jgi:hypothetical protein
MLPITQSPARSSTVRSLVAGIFEDLLGDDHRALNDIVAKWEVSKDAISLREIRKLVDQRIANAEMHLSNFQTSISGWQERRSPDELRELRRIMHGRVERLRACITALKGVDNFEAVLTACLPHQF